MCNVHRCISMFQVFALKTLAECAWSLRICSVYTTRMQWWSPSHRCVRGSHCACEQCQMRVVRNMTSVCVCAHTSLVIATRYIGTGTIRTLLRNRREIPCNVYSHHCLYVHTNIHHIYSDQSTPHLIFAPHAQSHISMYRPGRPAHCYDVRPTTPQQTHAMLARNGVVFGWVAGAGVGSVHLKVRTPYNVFCLLRTVVEGERAFRRFVCIE